VIFWHFRYDTSMHRLKNIPWKKVLLVALASILLLVGALLVWASTIRLPDVSTFEARKIANSSKITDRTGEVVLYDIHQSVRRTEVPLAQMSDHVKNAVVAIEDAHFYQHSGIRPTSIIRAVFVNTLKGSFSQGGSTITQQIIKNTLLNTDKTVVRKFKEWILALKVERQFTKDQILQIYLNDAPFGSTIYGVEEASRAFFNKSSSDLTIAESAYLAAMMPAPSYYSPFGTHKDRLTARKTLVLKKMKEYGYITEAEYVEADAENVVFNSAASNSIKAPHFVFYILDYLQKKYGEDVMESGGYTIKTTLDYSLQEKAEKIVSEQAAINLKKFKASNSALVAIDPTTGQILSMVGSKNYFDKTIDGAYNVAIAHRQPGSSFKPFVYATAFAEGYTPETVLFDVPTEFSTSCGSNPDSCYHPSNFDDKFKGPISLRSALAESRNVPSVKLLYLVGVQDAINTAHSLGITTLQNKDAYGLSLVLGGGEVSLLDMTSAYGVFANNGLRNMTTGILEIRDRRGSVIEEFQQNTTEAMPKNAVLTLNSVLSDAQARVPTFGNSITIPGVAVKTGTTNDARDAWIVGYTPSIAVGVWSGNNNNASMTSGGGAVSGPIWKAFMEEVLKTIPLVPFEQPMAEENPQELKPVLRGEWMGNNTVWIDKITGLRATENTPPEAREERVITDVHDILFWVNKNDPRGPVPSNPNSDPQFRLWEGAVQRWWAQNKYRYQIVSDGTLPSGYETVHTPENTSVPVITGLPGALSASDTATITITTTNSQYPLTSVDIFINNNYVTNLSEPFRFMFKPSDYGFQPGTYTVKAVGTNSIYAQASTEQTITINE
jgi:1A family penicillin-binding protein